MGGKCTHCGNTKHTRDTYFKLHGYPNWWHELQARKKKDNRTAEKGTGRAVVVIVEPQLSLIPMVDSSTIVNNWGNYGQVLCSSSTRNNGATDHMTFYPSDFSHTTQPWRVCIVNANDVAYLVTGARTVPMSPSLSNKLILVSQVTKEVNCVVLIYLAFCLLQDILNKEIIGHGTKRGGLYYLDDFSPRKTNHMQTQVNSKERQI